MPSGPPLPLLPEVPVIALLQLVQDRTRAGVWLRGLHRQVALRIRRGSQTCRIVLGSDLGCLLQRCDWIALRLEGKPVLVQADDLIRCRALQVVTGTPYLPRAEHLAQILPGALLELGGFSVPTRHRSPEEVLGLCLAYGIPVSQSRIGYLV